MMDDRWEYRIWPDDPAPLAGTMAAMADAELAAESRTDHYLLTGDDRLLAKIRGGERFEVKELIETRGGCERWMLAISEPFPVGAVSLERLLGQARDMPTAKALIEAAASFLTILSVRKNRRLFRLGAAIGEITSVDLGKQTFSTLAIEVPTADECAGLAVKLGFADHDNTDYGSFLRRRS